MAEKKDNRYVSDNARLMAEWNWESNDNIGLIHIQFYKDQIKKRIGNVEMATIGKQ